VFWNCIGRACVAGIELGAALIRCCIEDILLIADFNRRWALRNGKMIIATLEHLPELVVFRVGMLSHIFRCHAEWEGLYLKLPLSSKEAVAPQSIDVCDLLISHGIAAARRASAMYHQIGPGAVMCAVKLVWEAQIE